MKKIADNHQKNSHLDNFLHFHHFFGGHSRGTDKGQIGSK